MRRNIIWSIVLRWTWYTYTTCHNTSYDVIKMNDGPVVSWTCHIFCLSSHLLLALHFKHQNFTIFPGSFLLTPSTASINENFNNPPPPPTRKQTLCELNHYATYYFTDPLWWGGWGVDRKDSFSYSNFYRVISHLIMQILVRERFTAISQHRVQAYVFFSQRMSQLYQ